MTMTALDAWTIFRAVNLGQEEGAAALANLSEEDKKAYDTHVDDFQFKLAQIGIEANNEAAEAFAEKGHLLEGKRRADYTAQDYRTFLDVVDGTKYEKLHLTAFFSVQNNAVLLDLIKP